MTDHAWVACYRCHECGEINDLDACPWMHCTECAEQVEGSPEWAFYYCDDCGLHRDHVPDVMYVSRRDGVSLEAK